MSNLYKAYGAGFNIYKSQKNYMEPNIHLFGLNQHSVPGLYGIGQWWAGRPCPYYEHMVTEHGMLGDPPLFNTNERVHTKLPSNTNTGVTVRDVVVRLVDDRSDKPIAGANIQVAVYDNNVWTGTYDGSTAPNGVAVMRIPMSNSRFIVLGITANHLFNQFIPLSETVPLNLVADRGPVRVEMKLVPNIG
jgi:hypothetical protein